MQTVSKNALLVLPQYYFSFLSLASGQNVYVEYPLYQGYNIAFTAFAVMAFGILDRDVSPAMTYREPALYRRRFLSRKRFWAWMAEGFAQSFVCMVDGQLFGPFHRIQITPCRAFGGGQGPDGRGVGPVTRLTLPLMTFFPVADDV